MLLLIFLLHHTETFKFVQGNEEVVTIGDKDEVGELVIFCNVVVEFLREFVIVVSWLDFCTDLDGIGDPDDIVDFCGSF